MSNTSTENEALIKDLMYKCDCLYRENSRLREKVSAQPLGVAEKEAYERQLSEKDTIIAKKEAKISKLEERVAYLERQLYGRKAEKFIKPDAQDRWLDFEGVDMSPEEAEAAAEAEKELQAYPIKLYRLYHRLNKTTQQCPFYHEHSVLSAL